MLDDEEDDIVRDECIDVDKDEDEDEEEDVDTAEGVT